MDKPTAPTAAAASAAEIVKWLARIVSAMPAEKTIHHRVIRALAETIIEECDRVDPAPTSPGDKFAAHIGGRETGVESDGWTEHPNPDGLAYDKHASGAYLWEAPNGTFYWTAADGSEGQSGIREAARAAALAPRGGMDSWPNDGAKAL